MLGRSPETNPVTEENCEVLYRPPTDGEEKAHVHVVAQVTPKQVHIEKAAEDGTLASSEADLDGHWQLCRRELELYGSVYHTPTRSRYYRNREEAEAA